MVEIDELDCFYLPKFQKKVNRKLEVKHGYYYYLKFYMLASFLTTGLFSLDLPTVFRIQFQCNINCVFCLFQKNARFNQANGNKVFKQAFFKQTNTFL